MAGKQERAYMIIPKNKKFSILLQNSSKYLMGDIYCSTIMQKLFTENYMQ